MTFETFIRVRRRHDLTKKKLTKTNTKTKTKTETKIECADGTIAVCVTG